MFIPASPSTIDIKPAADTPVARELIFEIGVILAAHLALALAVAVVLRVAGEF